MIKKTFKKFFELESSTGILLFISTIFALLIANSQSYELYKNFLEILLPIKIEIISYEKNLRIIDWVNDALMAIFFLLVGLELKKEIMIGELSSKKKFATPAFGAIGGVIVPALIFYFFNKGDSQNLRGFAIPCATDIAFAYGMICLFGNKISNSTKIFLVTLAVIDDLIAIIIIALFYSDKINSIALFFTFFTMLILFYLNRKATNKISLYLLLGAFLWLAILKSGIHATVAGVILSFFFPLHIKNEKFLENFAHKIAPGVNFFILPIFAFCNAGVPLHGISFLEIFQNKLIFGTIIALFVGKQLGVMLFSFIAVRLNLIHLPRGASWGEFYGVSIFAGIGFTMSLFIGSLAFIGNLQAFDEVKIGVLIGSLLSVIFGTLVILLATKKKSKPY